MMENRAEETASETDADTLLQNLVMIVNDVHSKVKEGSIEIGITLYVGGLIITGNMVSSTAYFQGLAQGMAVADAPETIRNAFQGLFEELSDLPQPSDEELTSEKNKPPKYVHLKNAKSFLANGSMLPARNGVWWRGRLSEVDGFAFGTYSLQDG